MSNSRDEIKTGSGETEYVRMDRKKAVARRCVCLAQNAAEIDSYRVLRTKIKQNAGEKNWKTFMITSALKGEGKTLTAINLAVLFAKSMDSSALLVDCDPDTQNIHRYLGLPGETGLIDYLLEDEKRLQDIIVKSDIENLGIISGGGMVHDSSEILGSQKMKTLVDEMRERYEDRYIFFDVPPILGKADAIAFAPLVDCIIVVVEAGKTSVNDVKRALELIPGEKFIGLVLNRLKN